MILVDANLLLYAKISDYPQHLRTRPWLEAQINGNTRVGLPWPSLLAFVRIATNPRMFEQPLSVHDAWGQVREWLDLPRVWIPSPTPISMRKCSGAPADHRLRRKSGARCPPCRARH